MQHAMQWRGPAGIGLGLLLILLAGCASEQGRGEDFGLSSEDDASGTAGEGDGEGEGEGDSSTSTGMEPEPDMGAGESGEPECGNGIVEGDEQCDDGENDGSYGSCTPDCAGLGPHCGDGELDGPEQCDDGNMGTADGCLGNCQIPRSCREILEFDPNASTGTYEVAPTSPELGFSTTCDMTTEGGGWTEIPLAQLCSGNLEVALTAIDPGSSEGIDDMCRPFAQDGDGDHAYTFDVVFPPGFEAFYLSNFVIKAYAGPIEHSSEINPGVFVQSSWDQAYPANMMDMVGDVSFGSADDPGPVTSYAAELDATLSCHSCETPYPGPNGAPFEVGSPTTMFRIGFGEAGSQVEGWYPWWSGSVYLR